MHGTPGQDEHVSPCFSNRVCMMLASLCACVCVGGGGGEEGENQ